MSNPSRRPWFRFSLRTLLVAMTILCCVLGWQSSVVRRRQAVLRELRDNPAFQFTKAGEWARRFPPGKSTPGLARVPLVRGWLGDEAIQEIWFTRHYQGFSEAQLTRLIATFPEAEVRESLPLPCHPGCFPRGTLVATPHGSRAIESIQYGDLLTAILPSGKPTTAQVQSVFITTNRLWQVATDHGTLLTTETQPLCLADEGSSAADRTLPAGQLTPDDAVLCDRDGKLHSTRVLAVTPTDRTEKVFNLVLGNSEIFIAGGFLARSKPPAEIAAD